MRRISLGMLLVCSLVFACGDTGLDPQPLEPAFTLNPPGYIRDLQIASNGEYIVFQTWIVPAVNRLAASHTSLKPAGGQPDSSIDTYYVGPMIETWRMSDRRRAYAYQDFAADRFALMPSGEYMLAPGNWGAPGTSTGREFLLSLIRVSDGSWVRDFEEYEPFAGSLGITPNGGYAVGARAQDMMPVWDVATGRITRTIETDIGAIRPVLFSHDGSRLILGANLGTGVIRLSDGVEERRIECGWPPALSRSREQIVAPLLDESGIGFWDIDTGDLVQTLRGRLHDIYTTVATPDGEYVVTATREGVIGIWSIAEGKLVRLIQTPGSTSAILEVTPDGLYLVSAYGSTASFWDLELLLSY